VNNQVAAQQIGSLLTQSGVPAGHAGDIARRLLVSNTPAGQSPAARAASRLITSGSPRSKSLQNTFRPPETPARSVRGSAGKDGLTGKRGSAGQDGWFGADGQDGQDGEAGKDGAAGRDGVVDYSTLYGIVADILFRFGGGGGGGGVKVDLNPILRRLFALEVWQAEAQKKIAKIDQMERNLKALAKRVTAIEKKLKDTVECEKA
jgi:hypothetical protein